MWEVNRKSFLFFRGWWEYICVLFSWRRGRNVENNIYFRFRGVLDIIMFNIEF